MIRTRVPMVIDAATFRAAWCPMEQGNKGGPASIRVGSGIAANVGQAEVVMSSSTRIDDDLASVVRYALETTRATAVCPFHLTVTVRIGDDGAETHAYVRARRIRKSDGTTWDREVLLREFKRQLEDAADGVCPNCAG